MRFFIIIFLLLLIIPSVNGLTVDMSGLDIKSVSNSGFSYGNIDLESDEECFVVSAENTTDNTYEIYYIITSGSSWSSGKIVYNIPSETVVTVDESGSIIFSNNDGVYLLQPDALGINDYEQDKDNDDYFVKLSDVSANALTATNNYFYYMSTDEHLYKCGSDYNCEDLGLFREHHDDIIQQKLAMFIDDEPNNYLNLYTSYIYRLPESNEYHGYVEHYQYFYDNETFVKIDQVHSHEITETSINLEVGIFKTNEKFYFHNSITSNRRYSYEHDINNSEYVDLNNKSELSFGVEERYYNMLGIYDDIGAYISTDYDLVTFKADGSLSRFTGNFETSEIQWEKTHLNAYDAFKNKAIEYYINLETLNYKNIDDGVEYSNEEISQHPADETKYQVWLKEDDTIIARKTFYLTDRAGLSFFYPRFAYHSGEYQFINDENWNTSKDYSIEVYAKNQETGSYGFITSDEVTIYNETSTNVTSGTSDKPSQYEEPPQQSGDPRTDAENMGEALLGLFVSTPFIALMLSVLIAGGIAKYSTKVGILAFIGFIAYFSLKTWLPTMVFWIILVCGVVLLSGKITKKFSSPYEGD